jgi:hypothetical protein
MSSYAQTRLGSDEANSTFSFDLLEILISSILDPDKSLLAKKPASETSGSTNKSHEKMFSRASSPKPPIDCGQKCGNGDGNARNPRPRGNVE